MKSPEELLERYRDLQAYVNWSADDSLRLLRAGRLVASGLGRIVDDFYAEIDRHAATRGVITGGPEQIVRLKQTLHNWLTELFSGEYNAAYVQRRWRVGLRHVEIGLDQVYTTAALSRMAVRLMELLEATLPQAECGAAQRALRRLMELDLAMIEDAYQWAYGERQKRAERANFWNLVEAAECMTVILRGDFTVCFFSPFAERLTGYSAAEVMGRDYARMFLPAEAVAGVTRQIERVLAGESVHGYENPVRCRDGTERAVLWNARRLEDYEGQPAVLAVGQDITFYKRANEKVLQTERLAAIGQMVTGLAHESRNALQRSRACLDMLALEVDDRPEAKDLVQRVNKAQEHLHRLYEEVRAYAAPLTLHREPCRLDDLWREVWSSLAQERQGKTIELREDIQDPNTAIEADEFSLGQVFRNILENAIAACPPRGVIRVSLEPWTFDDCPGVRVRFHDNGPGLNAEQRQKIFEPFYTTKTRGTGLGMAITKRIVEAHNGAIAVGDSPQGGAVILLTLPREALPM